MPMRRGHDDELHIESFLPVITAVAGDGKSGRRRSDRGDLHRDFDKFLRAAPGREQE